MLPLQTLVVSRVTTRHGELSQRLEPRPLFRFLRVYPLANVALPICNIGSKITTVNELRLATARTNTNATVAAELTKVHGKDGRVDVLHSHFLVAMLVGVAASA